VRTGAGGASRAARLKSARPRSNSSSLTRASVESVRVATLRRYSSKVQDRAFQLTQVRVGRLSPSLKPILGKGPAGVVGGRHAVVIDPFVHNSTSVSLKVPTRLTALFLPMARSEVDIVVEGPVVNRPSCSKHGPMMQFVFPRFLLQGPAQIACAEACGAGDRSINRVDRP
jgi:hypothetical protein